MHCIDLRYDDDGNGGSKRQPHDQPICVWTRSASGDAHHQCSRFRSWILYDQHLADGCLRGYDDLRARCYSDRSLSGHNGCLEGRAAEIREGQQRRRRADASADGMAMMEYTIKLTAQEVTLLGEVLGNAPYRTIAALMAKLQQQVS